MKYYKIIFCSLLTTIWLQSCGIGSNTSTTTTTSTSTENENTSTTQTSENVIHQGFILDELFKYNNESDLVKAFGKSNIKRGWRYAPEGLDSTSVTLIYPNTKNEVAVGWHEEKMGLELSSVEIEQEGTAWKTANGMTVGTTLKELEKLNGKPFDFNGFGWDYGGFPTWGENTPLTDGGYFARLDIIIPEGELMSPEFERLLGDQVIKSNLPLAQKANIRTTLVGIYRE